MEETTTRERTEIGIASSVRLVVHPGVRSRCSPKFSMCRNIDLTIFGPSDNSVKVFICVLP